MKLNSQERKIVSRINKGEIYDIFTHPVLSAAIASPCEQKDVIIVI